MLIYTTTRKNAEKLASLLNHRGIEARHYHGKIPKFEKQEVLQDFKSGELNVVTATCAFGMGINRKDVRAVIHHTMSGNLENYIQEAGRAGRDGNPAVCTLLFNPDDADTIFFLQSLNQLSETDLKNIFIATRNIRDLFKKNNKVFEDWFWVTTNEIYQTSELDEEFASEGDQRDTKIKVALYHLEHFGLVERAENLSTFIEFELIHSNPQQSIKHFVEYGRDKQFSSSEIEQFKRLIEAMHVVKSYYDQKGESIPLDRLSDESGISVKELKSKIRDLEKPGVCNFKLPLSLLITKGVKGDARSNHQKTRDLEQKLLENIVELQNDSDIIQINLRGLATRLDPDGTQKVRAGSLKILMESWAEQKWLELTSYRQDIVRIKWLNFSEYLDAHKELTAGIIEVLYHKLGEQQGARLKVEYEMGKLLKDVSEKINNSTLSETELERAIFWLHRQKLIRITEGLNLFHQSLKIKVVKRANLCSIPPGYKKQVKPSYDEQARRTHIMLQYGVIPDSLTRQQLVQNYFSLSPQDFYRVYPQLASEQMKLPVTEDDYHRILDSLNETQRKIVLSENHALAVIAGPGSGKTRTIIHRIAYLVKVKRVRSEPDFSAGL